MVLINLAKNTYVHPQKEHDSGHGNRGIMQTYHGVDYYSSTIAPQCNCILMTCHYQHSFLIQQTERAAFLVQPKRLSLFVFI